MAEASQNALDEISLRGEGSEKRRDADHKKGSQSENALARREETGNRQKGNSGRTHVVSEQEMKGARITPEAERANTNEGKAGLSEVVEIR